MKAVNDVAMQSKGGEPSAEIRKAASLLAIRNGPDGLEVLVMRRTQTMRFLPGFLSFPGGSLNASDDEVDASRWANALCNRSQPDDATYAVGALRETVEETGCLFAVQDERGVAAGQVVAAGTQTALLQEELSYLGLLERLGVQIDGKNLRFVGRWVTPPFMSKRFDTRFFATVVDEPFAGMRVNLAENEWVKWCSPHALLHDIAAKQEKAAPPTLAMLKALAEYAQAEACFARLHVPGPDPDDPVLRSVLDDL